jgi:hypothetical protein
MTTHTASRRAAVDRHALLAEMEAKLPGLATHMERNNPGMHTTDTIDFEYIIEGEVWLELDEGAAVHLRAGDPDLHHLAAAGADADAAAGARAAGPARRGSG